MVDAADTLRDEAQKLNKSCDRMDGASLSGKAVGQPIKRLDGISKVTGRARYAGDIELPGMLFGR